MTRRQFFLKQLPECRALLPGILFVFSSCAVSAGEFSDTNTYQHDTAWPKNRGQFHWGVDEGKEPGTAESASGIGVDNSKGLIYALVRSKPHVRVFQQDGSLAGSWSPEKVGRVHMLHVDQSGNVWIADNHGHTVTQYTPLGEELLRLGTYGVPGMDGDHFAEPTDVATTDDGEYIFISDGYINKRVAKFDRSGNYLGMWGGKEAGRAEGQFILPHSLTVTGNRVYVADREGARIQVFDLDGNFIEDWRDVLVPWAIASVNNHLLVAGEILPDKKNTDAVTSTTIKGSYIDAPVRQDIVIFNDAGKVINEISLPQGNKFGQVNWLHAIDVDKAGNVYLADVVGNHIQRWKKIAPTRNRGE